MNTDNCGICGGNGDVTQSENHTTGCPYGDLIDSHAALERVVQKARDVAEFLWTWKPNGGA